MNLGGCPYAGCDGFFSTVLPERTPVYYQTVCDLCQRVVWLKLSRVDPEAYTEDSFVQKYLVNKETHTIEPREKPQPLTGLEKAIADEVVRRVMGQALHDLMFGMGSVCFWGCEFCPKGAHRGQDKVDRLKSIVEQLEKEKP